jgi:hypothetical protein
VYGSEFRTAMDWTPGPATLISFHF